MIRLNRKQSLMSLGIVAVSTIGVVGCTVAPAGKCTESCHQHVPNLDNYPLIILDDPAPDTRAQLEKGISHLRGGNHQSAIDSFLEAEASDSNNADASYLLGVARYLYSGSRPEWVAEAFNTAIEKKTDHSYAHYGLCRLQERTQALQEALDACKTSHSLTPDFIPAQVLKATLSYHVAKESGLTSDREQAKSLLEQAIVTSPRHNELLRFLALLVAPQDTAQGIVLLTKAINVNPHDAELLFTRGEAYISVAKEKEALADFQQAIRVEPTFEAPYRAAIDILEHQGRMEQANKIKIQADARFE